MIHYYRSIGVLVEYDRSTTHSVYRDGWASSEAVVEPKRLMLEMTYPFEDAKTIYGFLPYYWDIA